MPYTPATPGLPSLYYVVEGPAHGDLALLIHGWTCDLHDFTFTIPFLNSLGLQTVAFDLRGHGKSELVAEQNAEGRSSYGPLDFAADAKRVLDAALLDIDKARTGAETAEKPGSTPRQAIVMGHSIGGVAASYFAALYPQSTRGLVMIDPPFHTSAVGQGFAQMFSQASGGGISYTSMAVDIFSSVPGTLPTDMPAWLRGWILRKTKGTNEEVTRRVVIDAFNPDGLGIWENHVKFLNGETVGMVEGKTGARSAPRMLISSLRPLEDEMALGVRECDAFVRYDRDGHWLHMQHADRFNAAVRAWLEKNDFLPHVVQS